MSRMILLLPLLLLFLASGCARTATISGKVKVNGRPVTSGEIVVLNPDGKSVVRGTIQSDSSYSVSGVRWGHVKVAVLSPDPVPSQKTKPADWFSLPHSLGNPGTSGLECDVNGSSVPFDIDVKK